MIPKKIHYCWFGKGPMPELALKCIESWHKYLPEYEFKEWNESNFDLDLYPYARQAYDNRKFAFVTDVVRLYALYTEGGIYMDTDVEVIKPLDELLDYEAVSGFENKTQVPTGLMASVAGSAIIKELLDEYDYANFIKSDGSMDCTSNVIRITSRLVSQGLNQNNKKQCVNGFTMLPTEYLCPMDADTRRIKITGNTLCIHHFSGSWLTGEEAWKHKQMTAKNNWIPKSILHPVVTLIATLKFRSLSQVPQLFKEYYKCHFKKKV